MDKSSKKMKIQARRKKELTFSHDNDTVQSNRSGSSQNVDSVAVNANTENTEFVNHAFILWTEMRQQWVGNRPPEKAKQLAEPGLGSNAIYENLYENLLRTKGPFSQRIPLPVMIEFLVKEWKEERLYVPTEKI